MASRGRAITRLRHAKSCVRKERFATEDEAVKRARALIGKGEAQIGSLNAYRCRACKQYHIGHTPTWRRADPA